MAQRTVKRYRRYCGLAAVLLGVGGIGHVGYSFTTSQVGLDALWSYDPTLKGNGITVVQAEATDYFNPNDPDGTMPYDPQFDHNDFEVNSVGDTNIPSTVPITYINAQGQSQAGFPNSVGFESAHADSVADVLFGNLGAAPGLAAVLNYNANYFLLNNVANNIPVAAKVVNQSFTDEQGDANGTSVLDQVYDNYVETNGTIIVTAAGNGGAIQDPGTAYNVITVGAFDNGFQATSVGPTADGRSKPDIAAPADLTSFATPWVSGIAAIMVQAGTRGTGGNATAAVQPMVVKALLPNGAVKNDGWTHTTTSPLDPTTGAGIVNAYNSYMNLAGGFAAKSATTHVLIGTNHPAPTASTFQHHLGWTSGSVTASLLTDGVDHYFLDLSAPAASYGLTATLVWDRAAGGVTDTTDSNGNPVTQYQITTLQNLDLYLYNMDTHTFVDSSVSTVDNVEELYETNLAPGHYDVQVLLHGGTLSTETQNYALAWRALATAPSGTIAGDANFDGVVDIKDLQAVANNWQRVGVDRPEGDVNGDGVVDIKDLQLIANNWQSGSGSGGGGQSLALMSAFSSLTQSVPEPGTVGLIGLGIAASLVRRSKKYSR